MPTTTTIDYRDLWRIAGNTTWSTTTNTGYTYEPATTAYTNWHGVSRTFYDNVNVVDMLSSSELQKTINSFSGKDLKPDPEKLLDLLEA